jgi:hypothetical protein
MRMIHKLKIVPHFYEQVVAGLKPFEIRENDRDYKVGDILHLCPYDPLKQEFLPSRGIRKRVSFVLSGWGLRDGYVALGLANE